MFSEKILRGSGDDEGVRLWLLQNFEEEGLVRVEGACNESGGEGFIERGMIGWTRVDGEVAQCWYCDVGGKRL